MSSKMGTATAENGGRRALTPKLRFPEFRNFPPWEATTIGELGSFYYGKSAPKWSLSDDALTPCVRYGELYTKFGATITETYSRTNIDPATLRFSKGGEILVPRVGEKPEDFGKCCCYLALANIAIGEMISVFETEQHPLFYTYYFRLLYKQFAKVVEGQNVKNLYYAELEPLPIHRPPVPEQQKIADCLSSVDALIAAQARKVDALKTHKKGLMQQLFPREGETQPRLRFPKFRGAKDWEVKRVDERGDVLAGKALAVDAPGPLRPYLRTKNVLDGAINLSDVLTMPMTDAEFSRFEILDGDVLLNEGQSLELVGRASIYRGEFDGRCAMQNQLLRFRAYPSTCPEFAAQAFRKYQKDGTFANVATQTTSVAHLGSSRFSSLSLAWPASFAEQHCIAHCLTSLDDLIAAQTQKLDALKTHKMGLMQQLFPSIGEADA